MWLVSAGYVHITRYGCKNSRADAVMPNFELITATVSAVLGMRSSGSQLDIVAVLSLPDTACATMMAKVGT